jgi:hypothetical protein
MDYDWGSAIPVRDGKLWIWATSSPTNRHCYLYDANQRKVTGEFLHTAPVMFNAGTTRLLCLGSSLGGSLKFKLARWLEKSRLTAGLAKKINYEETFWVLDLRDNSSRRLGSLSQNMGYGSYFIPSPSGRFGYNKPSTSWGNSQFFVCDIESNLFTGLKYNVEIGGWWDDQHLLARDSHYNFVLFDIATRATTTLLSAGVISNTLAGLDLPSDPRNVSAYTIGANPSS